MPAWVGPAIMAAGSVAGGLLSGKKGEYKPPSWLWDFWNPASQGWLPGKIMDAYKDAPDVGYYPGDLTAPFSANERQGQNMLMNYAMNDSNMLNKAAIGGFGNLMNPGGMSRIPPGLRQNLYSLMGGGGYDKNALNQALSGNLSPHYQDVLTGSLNDIKRAYTDTSGDIWDRAERDLFASDDDALLAGMYGGSSRGTGRFTVGKEFAKNQRMADQAMQENMSQAYSNVMNEQFNQARDAQLRALGLQGDMVSHQASAANTMADLYSSIYGNDIRGMMGGLEMLPKLHQGGMLPGTIMSNIGKDERGLNQAAINAEIERWMFNNQQAPWHNIQQYTGMVSPLLSNSPYYAGGGSNNNWYNNAIGGALMGYGLQKEGMFDWFGQSGGTGDMTTQVTPDDMLPHDTF